MRRTTSMILLAAMLLALSACGGGKPQETKSQETAPQNSASQAAAPQETEPQKMELTVFAAASMTETLTEIKTMYEKDHSGVTITYNFDSSGTLLTQIKEGAECDLFISAAPKQMNTLDEEGSLAEGSRVDLLENQVVLCVPERNRAGIDSFDGLAQALKSGDVMLAMGNSDVPVGQYTQKILAYYGLSEEELSANGCVTYGTNVKEVTAQVSEACVDCGVIYCTDAFSAGLTMVDSATAEMCGQVIYPASVLRESKNQEGAQAFLDYLKTDAAMEVFERVGFSPAG